MTCAASTRRGNVTRRNSRNASVLFNSNAILLYLAEKIGKFLPENTPGARVAALKDRHSFKTEMDANARRHMFPHTIRAPA